MTGYSVQRTYGIFVKGYGFLSFAKNMGKDNGKNISKNLSVKQQKTSWLYQNNHYSYAWNCLQKAVQKTTDTTDDLTGN